MKYKDLDKVYKKKLSASITSYIMDKLDFKKFTKVDPEYIFFRWIKERTKMIDEKRYYLNKGVALKDYELDDELLDDLALIFEERIKKNEANIREKFRSKVLIEKLRSEVATEKQIFYANMLYESVYGEEGNYLLGAYNQDEIGEIIETLKMLQYRAKRKEREELEKAKIINLEDYK